MPRLAGPPLFGPPLPLPQPPPPLAAHAPAHPPAPSPLALPPQVCNKTAIDAPCHQPLLSAEEHDKVHVVAKLASPQIKTNGGLKPTGVTIKLCFSKPFTKDRPWRKAADVIDVSLGCLGDRGWWGPAPRLGPCGSTPATAGFGPAAARPANSRALLTARAAPTPAQRRSSYAPQKDKACPQTVAKLPIGAGLTSYEGTFSIPKAMPRATWYAQVMVTCMNDTAPVFCQYDNTVNKTYVATEVIDSTPPAMKVAVGICSAIAPAFLIAFFLKENVLKKRA
jgi:hypothetical protein